MTSGSDTCADNMFEGYDGFQLMTRVPLFDLSILIVFEIIRFVNFKLYLKGIQLNKFNTRRQSQSMNLPIS